MEGGSIAEVFAHLKLWCDRRDYGFARVGWDSVDSRREVVRLLREVVSVAEIELPPDGDSYEIVSGLIEKLRSLDGEAVSITGIERAFPEGGSIQDTLGMLSYRRESLAAIPVSQIWWVPSHLTGEFVRGVPDLDSWFRLKLHLSEVTTKLDKKLIIDTGPRSGERRLSVAETRALESRFWERLDKSRAQSMPEERIWTELAEPAVDALSSAGLLKEADKILASFSEGTVGFEGRLQDLRSTWRDEHPEVLSLMERLARVRYFRGDFPGARALGEAVVEARRATLGEEHPATLAAMHNLASTLWSQGNLKEAGEILEQVLESRRNLLGDHHPDTMASMNYVAQVLRERGDPAAARQLHEELLATCRRMLGDEHPHTLTAMLNLASTLDYQGDFAGARRLEEGVLAARRRILGNSHPDTLIAINNLALTLFHQKDYDGARRLQESVLETERRILGENHLETLTSMNNLALSLHDLGDLAAARRLQEQVLGAFRSTLGDQHPRTLTAMHNLGLTMVGQGESAGRRLIDSDRNITLKPRATKLA